MNYLRVAVDSQPAPIECIVEQIARVCDEAGPLVELDPHEPRGWPVTELPSVGLERLPGDAVGIHPNELGLVSNGIFDKEYMIKYT